MREKIYVIIVKWNTGDITNIECEDNMVDRVLDHYTNIGVKDIRIKPIKDFSNIHFDYEKCGSLSEEDYKKMMEE